MKTNLFRTIFTGFFILFSLFPVFLFAQTQGNTGTQKITAASIFAANVTASPIWNLDLVDTPISQPFLQAESAVLAYSTDRIKSFYMTGTQLWNFDPEDQVTNFIARSVEGAAYMCDASGNFRAVNRVGRELWRLNLGMPISFPPVVGWDGRIFIPVGSQIYCRTASGLSLWNMDLGRRITVAPILDSSGGIATVLENREFVKISAFSTIDRIALNRQPLLIVSVKSDSEDSYVLFYSAGETEKITYNENAASGSRLARRSFPSLPALPVAVAGREDRFAVTMRDGRVQSVNVTGQTLWTGNTHASAAEKGAANLEPGQVYMVYDERGIYSISTRGATGFAADGRRRFILKFEEAATIPALSDEGLLYVPGKNNYLYLYKLDSRPRTAPRYRYYGYPPEGKYELGPPSPWATDGRRFNEDEQNRMLALIERAVNSGQIGEREPAYTAYLHEMIGFFLNDPGYSRFRPRVTPVRRVQLIRLLGRIGSRDTIPFLWHIFDRDEEPSIKAACAEAIGRIGVDPTGRTFVSYNFFLAPSNIHRDTQLLMSATASIAALCRFSGPPLAYDGILLLRLFSNLTWAPSNIKSQIRNELDALYREGIDKVLE